MRLDVTDKKYPSTAQQLLKLLGVEQCVILQSLIRMMWSKQTHSCIFDTNISAKKIASRVRHSVITWPDCHWLALEESAPASLLYIFIGVPVVNGLVPKMRPYIDFTEKKSVTEHIMDADWRERIELCSQGSVGSGSTLTCWLMILDKTGNYSFKVNEDIGISDVLSSWNW